MKLTAKNTDAFLKNPGDARGALLYGPDEGLARERAKLLHAACAGTNADPLSLIALAGDRVIAEPSLLFEAASAMTLIGAPPVVTVFQAGDKLTPIVRELLETPECKNFLVLCGSDLGTKSSLRALFEKDSRLAAIGCHHDSGEALARAVRQEFERHGVRCDAEALAHLTGTLGNDHAVTRSEIAKILLYLGEEKRLDAATAQMLTGDNADQTLDKLCASVLDGDPGNTLSIAEKLLSEGTAAIAALRALARYVDRLREVHALEQSGIKAEDALARLRPAVFYQQVPAFRRHLRAFPEATLARMQASLVLRERALKRQGASALHGLHSLQELAAACAAARRR